MLTDDMIFAEIVNDDYYCDLFVQNLFKNIKILRYICGLTSKELANKLGVSRSTMNKLETDPSCMTRFYYYSIMWILMFEAHRIDSTTLLIRLFAKIIGNNNPEVESELNAFRTIIASNGRKVGVYKIGEQLRDYIFTETVKKLNLEV